MRTLGALAAIATLAATTACGGGGGGNSLADLAMPLAHAECTKLFACCGSAEIAELSADAGESITTEAQCESVVGAQLGVYAMFIQTSIDAGRVDYDGDAASACIDSITAATCDAYHPLAGAAIPCAGVFTPKVAVGGECDDSVDCIASYCADPVTGSDTLCAAVPAAGSACTDTCGSGDYCGLDAGGSNQICDVQQAVGSACANDVECASNECDNADSGSGSCAAASAGCYAPS